MISGARCSQARCSQALLRLSPALIIYERTEACQQRETSGVRAKSTNPPNSNARVPWRTNYRCARGGLEQTWRYGRYRSGNYQVVLLTAKQLPPMPANRIEEGPQVVVGRADEGAAARRQQVAR
jgi:hypothetical protein